MYLSFMLYFVPLADGLVSTTSEFLELRGLACISCDVSILKSNISSQDIIIYTNNIASVGIGVRESTQKLGEEEAQAHNTE